MPMGRYPEKVKDFRKWSTDQVDRGSVAGNKVTSFRKKNSKMTRRRRSRLRKERKNG